MNPIKVVLPAVLVAANLASNAQGTVQIIDGPYATQTTAYQGTVVEGLNDNGYIAGYASDDNMSGHGTVSVKINGNGTVAEFYIDSNLVYRGFVWNP